MKTLPHDTEIERALLGGLILQGAEPTNQLAEVSAILTADDFFKPLHQSFYRLILRQQERGASWDLPSLAQMLSADPDQVMAIAYLYALPGACPSVEPMQAWASKIRELSLRRQLIDNLKKSMRDVLDPSLEFQEIVASCERRIGQVAAGLPATEWQHIAGLTGAVVKQIEQRAEQRAEAIASGLQPTLGIPSPWQGQDKITGGWSEGDLVIVGARPAMGKTSYAINVALAAARAGAGVGVFSLEMTDRSLVERALAGESEVDGVKLRDGDMDGAGAWNRLQGAVDDLVGLPIWIDAMAAQTISTIKARVRRLKTICPHLGLIIIDYLQLMQAGPGGDKNQNREQQIAAISRGLKILAKDEGICIIALSQLNRTLESRADKRPMMSDLRESGAVEQDADMIIFLYRDEVYHEDSADKGIAEIIYAKNRRGTSGDRVRVAWIGKHYKFGHQIADSIKSYP